MQTITFKTITQLSFTLDLDPKQTIADVKKQIAAEKGEDYAVELQKLIYNGKILDDATTVEQAAFDANKFIVVMLSRKKQPEPTSAAPTVTAPTVTAPTVAAPTVETVSNSDRVTSTPTAVNTPATQSIPTTQSTPVNPSFTADQEASIEAIQGMGYPKDQVVAALRAAYWNAERAVEYLLTGIPEEETMPILVEGQEEENTEDIGSGADLAHLRDLPQLEELRALVRTNPEILPTLIQQIATMNPQLMEAIQNNQDEFLRILNAPTGVEATEAVARDVRNPHAGRHVIELSEQEAAAIQRIKSMGFRVPDGLIVEAYLACDKNEEMAIDYILNRMTEDDI